MIGTFLLSFFAFFQKVSLFTYLPFLYNQLIIAIYLLYFYIEYFSQFNAPLFWVFYCEFYSTKKIQFFPFL